MKEQPIKGSAYHCIIDNKPLKELVSPISVEQMKNRGIITLDSTETNSVIYKLIEYINSCDYAGKGCVHADDISMQDSHIDDLFDDDQLVSRDSDYGSFRWAIMNDYRILKITCMPVNGGNCYSFELSTNSGLYYVDEVLDRDTGKTYFNVRREREDVDYGNGFVISSRVIRSVIKKTDINQLIENSKGQFKK